MPDPANIEALQVAKAQEGQRATQIQAVRAFLVAFHARDDYAQLDYRELLHAARDVLARELAQLGEEHHA